MDSWSPGTTDCEYSIMASNGSGGLASWTIAYQLPLRTQLEASAEESGFVEVPSDSRSYPWIGFMWDGTPIEIPAEIRDVCFGLSANGANWRGWDGFNRPTEPFCPSH